MINDANRSVFVLNLYYKPPHDFFIYARITNKHSKYVRLGTMQSNATNSNCRNSNQLRWRWVDAWRQVKGLENFYSNKFTNYCELKCMRSMHVTLVDLIRFRQQHEFHIDECKVVHRHGAGAICTTNINQYNFIIIICFVASMIPAKWEIEILTASPRVDTLQPTGRSTCSVRSHAHPFCWSFTINFGSCFAFQAIKFI